MLPQLALPPRLTKQREKHEATLEILIFDLQLLKKRDPKPLPIFLEPIESCLNVKFCR